MLTVAVAGHVVQSGVTDPGVLRVEIHSKNARPSKILAVCDSQPDGKFEVTIDRELIPRPRGQRPLSLEFRVFRDELPIRILHGKDLILRGAARVEPVIEIAGSGSSSTLVISGRVTNTDGTALPDIEVLALRLMVQGAQKEVGRATTNADGNYTIDCAKEDPASPTVITANAGGKELTRSSLICDTSGEVSCNLVVKAVEYQSPPEYTRLMTAVLPQIGAVPLKNLSDDDLSILACAAQVPLAQLTALRAASQIVGDSKASKGAVYGLIREGLAASRQALFAQTPQVLTTALTAAVQARIVPAMTDDEIAAAVQLMVSLRISDVLAPNDPAGLSHLLNLAVSDQTVQAAIVQAYNNYQGDPDTFWSTTLAQVKGLENPGVRAGVELVAAAGTLTFGHSPLIEALLSANSPVKINNVRDLATLQTTDWKTLITSQVNGATVAVPAGVPGATDDAKATLFAQAVAQSVAANMPTAAMAAALARSGNTALAGASTLLNQQPDYELAGAPVTKQFPLAANATPADQAALLALTQVQRIYKLTPNVDEVIALQKAGYTSSWDIARATPQDLVNTAGLSITRAQTLQQLAGSRVQTVLGVIGKYGAQAAGTAIPAVPALGSVATASQQADLVGLFGPETVCTCEEFRSLDGYWAYFVSLMFFLPMSARKVLKGRRPDLWGLRFSQANAETNDRYLSLALEVLENAVLSRRNELAAPPQPAYVWPFNQTTFTADQLAAGSQYTNADAYTLLANPTFPADTVYPPALPFDFNAAQAKAFSALLGVTRSDLMEALQNRTNPAAPSPSTEAIAREWLGVPVAAWALLIDTSNPPPASAGLDLTKPANLLEVAGIKSRELVRLLNCRFINPPEVPFAQRVGLQTDGTCNADSSGAAITDLPGGAGNNTFFGRVARFVRLWRVLSWPMADVDLAIWQLSRATVDGSGLVQIAALARLRADVTLSLPELLTWWADIDSVQGSAQPSQLATLFPALPLNPPLPVPWNDAWPGQLSWVVTDPVQPSQLPAILSGLGITADDFVRLLPAPPATLTLPALSALYRQVSMARWLGFDIPSFLALLPLIQAQPFVNVMASRQFLRAVDRLRASGFSLTELRYLLAGQLADDAPASFVISSGQAIDLGTQIRALLTPMPADVTPRQNAVVAKVAAYFSIASAAAGTFLAAPFQSPIAEMAPLDYLTNQVLLDTYWIPGGAGTTPATAAVTDLQTLMTQLTRQALLVGRLSLTADEVGRLAKKAAQAGSGWLDLTRLPQPTAAPATFEMLEPWLAYQSLARSQPPLTPPLLNVLDPPAAGPAPQWSDVAACFVWDSGDVTAIAQQTGLTAPTAPQDVRNLQRVSRAMRLLKRGSLTVSTAVAWIAEPVSAPASNNVVSAARACVGEQNWSAAAQPIRNQVLVQQRNALLAYLFGAGLPGDGTTSFPDSDDVRDRYLVDPLVGPEFITTRLELALQTLQLFADRCFRGQEQGIVLTEALAEQWKNFQGEYRVWQAAVDIWLTPWAYADFSILDRSNDRFTAFTQALTQRDVTRDNVADALEDYLQALADIAYLEVAGYYEDFQSDGSKVLHVIGRTAATPATYYHARRDGASWSPWQKISADINAGDSSVMVAMFHSKLFVAWPVITTKSDTPALGPVPKSGAAAPDPPSSYPEFQIGWTVLKNGVWSAKQISDTVLKSDWPSYYPNGDSTEGIVFRAGVIPAPDDPTQLQLRVSLTLWDNDDAVDTLINANGDPLLLASAQTQNLLATQGGEPEFGFTSCTSAPVIHSFGVFGFLFMPLLSTITWNGFLLSVDDRRVQDRTYVSGAPNGLKLYSGTAPDLPYQGQPWPDPYLQTLTALQASPTPYQLLFSAQYSQPVAQSFCFQDDRWSFYAEYLRTPITPVTSVPLLNPAAAGGWQITKPVPITIAGTLATRTLDKAVNVVDVNAAAVAAASGFISIQNGLKAGSPQVWPTVPITIGYKHAPLYRFYTFCHPTVCSFLEALDAQGLSGLLRRDPTSPIQNPAPPAPEFFNARYKSNFSVVDNGHLPNPGVEFTTVNPYGQDNQNVFYYGVGAAAVALTGAGRFDDAEWFWRAIFDPMDGSSDPAPTRYWKYEPLRTALTDTLNDLYGLLNADPDIAAQALDEVEAWTADPFDPWAVAESRPIALMKIAVRNFLLNWLTQADQFYAQATDQETLMRAADGYIRCLEILGPAPEPLEPTPSAQESPNNYHCFADLENNPPGDASLPVIIESALPPLQATPTNSPTLPADSFPWSTAANLISAPDPVTSAPAMVFCIPPDTSFDQLRQRATTKINNIRAGLNFNGQPQVYSTFGTRIDPALLARAAAAGIDLSNATSGVAAPPRYLRFAVLLQRAKDFAGELERVSGSLLGALTDDSAETLNELRAGQEVALLAKTLLVKQAAQTEAQETLASLQAYQQVLQARYQYYSTRQLISVGEAVALNLTEAALVLQAVAGAIGLTSGELSAIPNFTVGVEGIGGTPTVTVTEGGSNVGGALTAVSRALDLAATLLHAQSGAIATVASYQRRMDDWQMLANTTNLELTQVAAQIEAQQARVAAAAADLAAFQQQQENADAVQSYLQSRVNNVQFRAFRINQLSSVAHQGYLLAYSLAKAAEGAYQFERYLGSGSPPSFIQFGYWQNNYDGMTAAEQLGSALQQMEFAYTTVDPGDKPWPSVALSLAMMQPSALESLRCTGDSGVFSISELQFLRIRQDAYFLRIRRLRVRIPSVSGPYTPLLFKVQMQSQGLRLSGDQYQAPSAAGSSFYSQPGLNEVMYTTGRADESEPTPIVDGQYRPFEGYGPAESQFQISFPAAMAALYGASIADVIFEFELTSRVASSGFAGQAVTALTNQNLMQLQRLTTDYPNQWYQATSAPAAATSTFTIPLTADRFPYAGNSNVTMGTLAVMAVWSNTSQQAAASGAALSATLGGVVLNAPAAAVNTSSAFAAIPNGSAAVFDPKNYVIAADAVVPVTLVVTLDASKLPAEWTNGGNVAVNELLDLVALVTYSVT
jgi:Tc toxin complex TcA C-terminal TcB-binding domain/Neuraminidase-like domain